MDNEQLEEERIKDEIARLSQQLEEMTKKRLRKEKREKLRLEIDASQPERPKSPRSVEQVAYKYGTFELRIYGDPNRLFDIPIAYYTSRVFSAKDVGAKDSIHDKANKLADD